MKKALILSLALTTGLLGAIPAFAQSNTTTYTIQKGDTFWLISQKFNMSLTSVLAANSQIDPTNLYVGENVIIPVADITTASAAPVTQYTVQTGDTFWLISQKLNLSLNSLIAANSNIDPTNMYPGMKINLPASSTSAVSAETNQLSPPTTIENAPSTTVMNTVVPTYLADGQFPLKPGTYTPFTDSYGDGRTFNADGTAVRKHEGVDIMAKMGTSIYSAYDGTVINKGWNTLGGWRLTVRTPDGKTAFYYAHMSAYASGIVDGSKISKGQVIGYVGNTGYGPEGTSGLFETHLHFGMYDIASGFSAEDPYNNLKYWEKNSLTAKY